MKNTFLGIFTLWALLLAPGLCVGGLVEHACVDCTEISCSHEQDCTDDPCNEAMLRVSPFSPDDLAATMVVVAAGEALTASTSAQTQSFVLDPPPPVGNFPRYQSDQPLLI